MLQIFLHLKTKYLLIISLLHFASSCRQINSNHELAALDFCEEISHYEETKDYDKANECLERYWNACYSNYRKPFKITLDFNRYGDKDHLGCFCENVRKQLRTQKYRHLCAFIGDIDTKKHPVLLDFKKYVIRQLRNYKLKDFWAFDDIDKNEFINRQIEMGRGSYFKSEYDWGVVVCQFAIHQYLWKGKFS